MAIATVLNVGAGSSASNRWVISPLSDSLFIIGTPLIILAVVLPALLVGVGQTFAILVIGFLATGHHFPGFLRVYGDRELFSRYSFRFVLLPPVLFGVAWWCSWNDLNALPFIVMCWGIWHGLMQIYGFCRIYDAKNGDISAATSWMDWLLCLSWFTTMTLWSPYDSKRLIDAGIASGMVIVPDLLASSVRWAFTVVMILFSLCYLIRTAWLLLHGRDVSARKLALIAITLSFLVFTTRVLLEEPLVGLACWEAFHDIQYFAIVWSYNRRLNDRSMTTAIGRFLFQPHIWLLALYVVVSLGYGGLDFVSRTLAGAGTKKTLAALLLTSAMLHFYYDGFIWKLRRSKTRRDLDIPEKDDAAIRDVATAVADRRREAGVEAQSGWKDSLQQLAYLAVPIALLVSMQLQSSKWELPLRKLVAYASSWSAPAQFNLGSCYQGRNRLREAEESYRHALEIDPDLAQARNNLGVLLIQRGSLEEAAQQFQNAIRSDAQFADAYYNLSMLRWRSGDYAGGIQTLRTGVAVVGNTAKQLATLATMLATCPNVDLRDGESAVVLALGALELAGEERPDILDTLAAAYAEAGKLEEAVTTAKEALGSAMREGDSGHARSLENLLRGYEGRLARLRSSQKNE